MHVLLLNSEIFKCSGPTTVSDTTQLRIVTKSLRVADPVFSANESTFSAENSHFEIQ